MTDPVWIQLQGFKELDEQLEQLEVVMQGKILRKVLRDAIEPTFIQMQRLFHQKWESETGQLANSFGIRTSIPKVKNFADVFASAGVFKNKRAQAASGKLIDAPVYAYWLEHGVEPHSSARKAKKGRRKRQDEGGQHPGVTAGPFIRPAFDNNVNNMLNAQYTLLNDLINKALRNAR